MNRPWRWPRGSAGVGLGALGVLAVLLVPGAAALRPPTAQAAGAARPAAGLRARVAAHPICAHPQSILIEGSTHRLFIVCYHSVAQLSDFSGMVQVRDTRTLRLLATLPLGPRARHDMTVDRRRNHFFLSNIVAGQTVLQMFNLRTLALVRTIPGGWGALVDDADTRIFDGLHVLDARSGAVLGHYTSPGHELLCPISTRLRRMYCGRPPPHEHVLQVLALGAPPGPRMHVADFDAGIEAGGILVDEQNLHLLVTGGENGTGAVLDARTGAVLGPMYCCTRGQLSPLLDPRTNRVFFAMFDYLGAPSGNNVRVFDARRPTDPGGPLFTVALPGSPAVLAADPRSGRVFVGLGSPNPASTENAWAPPLTFVAVLDGRTGAFLDIEPLSGGIGTMAVDGDTGRLFVTNPDSGTLTVVTVHS